MRYSKCVNCGRTISEDDTNPNIHYSNPETVCWRCKTESNISIGSWLQDSNGNYYQKK